MHLCFDHLENVANEEKLRKIDGVFQALWADSLRDLNPAGLHRRRLDTAGVNDELVKLFTGLSSAFVKKKNK